MLHPSACSASPAFNTASETQTQQSTHSPAIAMFRTWTSYRRLLSVKARDQDRDQHGRFSNSSDAALIAHSEIGQVSAPDNDANPHTTPALVLADDIAHVPGPEQPLGRSNGGISARLCPSSLTVFDVLAGLLSAYALFKLWCTVSCLITRTHHVTLTDIVLIPHQRSASYGQVHTTTYECTRTRPFSTYHCYEHHVATVETKHGHGEYRLYEIPARYTAPTLVATDQIPATHDSTASERVIVVTIHAQVTKDPTSFQAVRHTAQSTARHGARSAKTQAMPGPSIVRAPTAVEARSSSVGYRAAADVIETIDVLEAKGCVTPGVTVRESGAESKSNPK